MDELQEQLFEDAVNSRKMRDDRDAQAQEVARLSKQLTEDELRHVHMEKTVTELRHDAEKMENRYAKSVYTHAHEGVNARKDISVQGSELRDMTELCAKLNEELSSSQERCKTLQFRLNVDLEMCYDRCKKAKKGLKMGIPLSLVRMHSFYVKADFSEWTKSQQWSTPRRHS